MPVSDELVRVQNDAYNDRVFDVAVKLRRVADAIDAQGKPSGLTPINVGQRHGLAAERVINEVSWMLGNLQLGAVVAAATAADVLETRREVERG